MPNVRVIDPVDIENAPELPLGLPPSEPTAAPVLRDLPIPVTQADLDAAKAIAARLDALEDPQHVTQIVRWLVARYGLVDLY